MVAVTLVLFKFDEKRDFQKFGLALENCVRLNGMQNSSWLLKSQRLLLAYVGVSLCEEIKKYVSEHVQN